MSDYTFNFAAGGAIVSYLEHRRSGKVERERIDRDEKAYLQSGMIVIEELDDGVLEWDVFRDGNGDGLWQKVASGETTGALQSTLAQLSSATPPTPTNPVPNPAGIAYTLEAGREDTLFRFDSSGRVTHEGEAGRNGKVDWDKVDRNDSYLVSGSFVLEQEFGRSGAEDWTLYSDADNDKLWAEAASGHGPVDFSALLAQLSANGATFA